MPHTWKWLKYGSVFRRRVDVIQKALRLRRLAASEFGDVKDDSDELQYTCPCLRKRSERLDLSFLLDRILRLL